MRIPAGEMSLLVRSGLAFPLLAGHSPAPMHYAQAWWHIVTPTTTSASPSEVGEVYVPADPRRAERYDQLAQRVRLVRSSAGWTPPR